MTACPTLVTERLILRPFEESDLDAYLELYTDPLVRRSLRVAEDFGRAAAWRSLALWRGQWELRGSGHFAVEERATGHFVGRAGLHRPELPDWPGLEAGWALHPRFWGRGYATEAGEASVAYAFEVMGADELVSVILPDNLRSQAVARRLGFTRSDRVVSHFGADHGVWERGRARWEESGRGRPAGATDGPL